MRFNKIQRFIFIFSVMPFLSEAIELRTIVSNLSHVKKSLSKIKATCKGSYSFRDYVYFPKIKTDDISYARIRIYQESNWHHKQIILTIKSLTQKVIYKNEYDFIREAQARVENDFDYAFQFFRQGWEYSWKGCSIYVEDIENLPGTVEVIATTKKEINDLFSIVGSEKILDEAIPIFYKNVHKDQKTKNN